MNTEANVRGYKLGLLTTADYNNLTQCETLDDIKLYLVYATGCDSLFCFGCIVWKAVYCLLQLASCGFFLLQPACCLLRLPEYIVAGMIHGYMVKSASDP